VYRVSSSGIKRQGRGVDHPPLSIVEVKERVELYLYSPLGLHCRFQGERYLSLSLCLFLPNFIYVYRCHSTSWLSSCVFIVLSCDGFLLFVSFTLFPPFFPCCLSFLFVSLCLFLCNIISFARFPLSYCLWLCPPALFCYFFVMLSVLSLFGPYVPLCTGWSSPGPSGGSGAVLPWPALAVLSLCMCVPPRAIRAGSARATRHYTVTHTLPNRMQ